MLKIGRCYIYPNQGSDTDWINQYQTTKAWMYFPGLLPKFLESSSQFHEIQTGGSPSEVLRMVKTKTIIKWELNTLITFWI